MTRARPPRRRALTWTEIALSASAAGFWLLAWWLRGFRLETASVVVFAIACALGLVAWITSLARYRIIHDTPVSRIATAAQGYVALSGFAAAFPGRALRSPLTHTPCVWYRYAIEKRRENPGFEEGCSETPFVLIDREGSGHCVIEPAGADVFSLRRNEWFDPQPPTRHSDRLVEWLLCPGDPLHAVGEFVTATADSRSAHVKADVRERLVAWKEDGAALRGRFDLDGDRQIDHQEWALARAAAWREVLREHAATQLEGQQHRLRRPPDGRPYLLGGVPARGLAWRYLAYAALNLIVCLAGAWGVWSGLARIR